MNYTYHGKFGKTIDPILIMMRKAIRDDTNPVKKSFKDICKLFKILEL